MHDEVVHFVAQLSKDRGEVKEAFIAQKGRCREAIQALPPNKAESGVQQLKQLQQRFRDLDEEYKTFRAGLVADDNDRSRAKLFDDATINAKLDAKRASNDELLREGKEVAAKTTGELRVALEQLTEAEEVTWVMMGVATP